MNRNRIFSAPGKLVIAGEYAVLEGFEALSSSIDRRVTSQFCDPPQKRTRQGSGNPNVVDCVIQEFQERGFKVPDTDINIDSSALQCIVQGSSIKLGAGSSAAVAVALTGAIICELGMDPKGGLSFEIALGAHRRFTQNRGSGIDVATSFFGGTIRFKSLRDKLPSVTQCELFFDPKQILAVHTGVAQSTNEFLEKLSEVKSRAPSKYHEAIFRIANSAQALIAAITKDDTKDGSWPDLCQAVREHNRQMGELGALAKINILSEAHRRVNAIAERHDGVAKPSGAGGGDIALCFVKLENQSTFFQELKNNSLEVLGINLSSSGLGEN